MRVVGVEVMSCLVSPGVREYSPTATNGQLSVRRVRSCPRTDISSPEKKTINKQCNAVSRYSHIRQGRNGKVIIAWKITPDPRH